MAASITSDVVEPAPALREPAVHADDHRTEDHRRAEARPSSGRALTLDAAVTGANGVAYLVLAGPLGDLFGLSEACSARVGAFLLVFAVLVG